MSIELHGDRMASKERMAAFAAGREIDRIPCSLFLGETAARFIGKTVSEYHHSPAVMAEVEIFTFRMFGQDGVGVGPGLFGVAEAMGTRLSFPEDGIAYVAEPALKGWSDLDRLKPPDPPIGAREYPLFYELTGSAQYLELPKAVLHDDPYPVRGLLINGSSTLTSYPQPEIFEDVYHRLDFMLVIDIITTRDALFADVVLPSATYYEINSYQRYPDYVRLRQQVIPPVGEARNQTMILAELARRLGYGHLYPQSEEELIAAAFARAPELLQKLQESPDGVSASPPERRYRKWETGDLRPDGQPGFPTPSGKVEVTSSLLAQYGYDSLPVYSEPLEGPLASPEAYEEFPLVLNTGARIQSTFRSQHLNVPGLLRLQVQPQALINPRDARVRSIEQGDRVVVSTKRGRVVFWARVTSEVLPGCVEVNMGGGNPCQVEAWRQSNANSLTDWRNRDPISGFPVFKALLCQVTSAENTG